MLIVEVKKRRPQGCLTIKWSWFNHVGRAMKGYSFEEALKELSDGIMTNQKTLLAL